MTQKSNEPSTVPADVQQALQDQAKRTVIAEAALKAKQDRLLTRLSSKKQPDATTSASPEQMEQSRQRLIASKPTRDQFQSDEEFDEAYNYWMQHQGRILSLTSPSTGSQQQSGSTDKT